MKCIKAGELLSEYVDGALDEQSRKLIEEHLSACKSCSMELKSLRGYIEAMGSLEKAEAPEEFLEDVKGRIRKRRSFRIIIEKLFVPMRIKVPLELVGTAAAAMLVIYVINNTEPSRDMAFFAQDKIKTSHVDELKPGREIFSKESVIRAESGSDKSEPSVKSQEKVVKLVLLIKPVHADGKGSGEVHKRSLLKVYAGKPDDDEMKDLKFEEKGAEVSEMPEVKKKKEEKMFFKAKRHEDKLLCRIADFIKSAGGEILPAEYDEESAVPLFINARVPAENYSALLVELEKTGVLRQSLPAEAVKEEGVTVNLRIEFIFPDDTGDSAK